MMSCHKISLVVLMALAVVGIVSTGNSFAQCGVNGTQQCGVAQVNQQNAAIGQQLQLQSNGQFQFNAPAGQLPVPTAPLPGNPGCTSCQSGGQLSGNFQYRYAPGAFNYSAYQGGGSTSASSSGSTSSGIAPNVQYAAPNVQYYAPSVQYVPAPQYAPNVQYSYIVPNAPAPFPVSVGVNGNVSTSASSSGSTSNQANGGCGSGGCNARSSRPLLAAVFGRKSVSSSRTVTRSNSR